MLSPELSSHATQKVTWRWLLLVWAALLAVTGWFEATRFVAACSSPAGAIGWLTYWNIETTLPFLVFLILPVLLYRSAVRSSFNTPSTATPATLLTRSVIVFALSMLCSWQVGSQPVSMQHYGYGSQVSFADLPPAYHDEYSYLLQARTFLDGRLTYPGMSVRPDLFHQMHVLNETRTVSRYFPWTGLWMAPFEAAGDVIVGHWIAGALSAVLFFLSAVQITDLRTATISGLLTAVSPGLAVFSNLLLAHHPTMLALSLFMWAFLRMMSTNRLLYAFISGTGLTLAMLGRPMTAAGFALPFGCWLLTDMICLRNLRPTIGFAVPLAFGFSVLAVFNHAATGSATRTAYQQYTETYTPHHRYGFNNAVDDQTPGPKVLTAYDRWAENLTPQVAVRNVGNRLFYSFQWTLAVFPLLFTVLMSVPLVMWGVRDSDSPTDKVRKNGLRIVAAAIVCLHLVHVPYWYDGIMHWHYVFETAPLLLMLAAAGATATYTTLRQRLTGTAAFGWITALLLTGVITGWFALPVFDNTSRISAAVSELAFARTRFAYFRHAVNSEHITRPALILIDERGADPQLSYVINPPDLDADVLTCRHPDTAAEVRELQTAFPDRTLYSFDPDSFEFTPL